MERAGGGVFLEERLVRNFSHVEDLLEREGNKRMFRAHVQGTCSGHMFRAHVQGTCSGHMFRHIYNLLGIFS